jgi:hypothetical protein
LLCCLLLPPVSCCLLSSAASTPLFAFRTSTQFPAAGRRGPWRACLT